MTTISPAATTAASAAAAAASAAASSAAGAATLAMSDSSASLGGTGSSGNALASLSSNFNDFLTLLTTQLQNQDPLSPLDTNDFTQQLVAMSGVEQQINTNANLQQLISLQGAGQTISALPLVGDTIEYSSATGPLTDGQANFVYSLPSATTSTSLIVTDANGNIDYTQPGQTAAGSYTFNWNGQTNAGVQLPDGNYTLQIEATGANGAAVTPTISSVGTVGGVSVENGTPTFTVGTINVPMSELVTVNPNLNPSN